MTTQIYTAQTNLINALVAFLNSETTRLTPEHATLAAACSRMALLLIEYASLTPANAGNYTEREAAVRSVNEAYAALSNVITQERLQSLEYQGVEIDLELVRFYLFGREMVVAPNV